MNKIHGLEYVDMHSDGYIFRMITLKKPCVRLAGSVINNTIELSSKFIEQSRRDRVHKIVVRIWNNNLEDLYYIDVPSEQDIYDKFSKGLYRDAPSKFVNGAPIRMFFFNIKK